MGHKVHPKIHRTPLVFPWDSRWFAKKEQLPEFLRQEVEIKNFLKKKLKESGIDAISLERTPKFLSVTILSAKPGVIIGRSGQGVEDLRKDIERKFLHHKTKVKLNIQAIKNPARSSAVVAQGIVMDIEKRIPFRRTMKQAIEKVVGAGAQGVKISIAGRLNGADIARRETLSSGKMSLITMRSDVDYAFTEAQTIYGKIGVKVWIYNGEVFSRRDKFEKKEEGDGANQKKRKIK